MSGDDDDWCTIESDPGVFTALLEDLGVSGVEVQELWSLGEEEDDEGTDSLASWLGPIVYGLIFLFEWKSNRKPAASTTTTTTTTTTTLLLPESEIPMNLFFAHQVTTNACATQALLSVLFNAQNNSTSNSQNTQQQQQQQQQQESAETAAVVETISEESSSSSSSPFSLGPVLSEFHSFTKEFPPSLKGVAISSSQEIKKVHNSFARPDAFLVSDRQVRVPTGREEAFHFVAYIPLQDTVYELDGLQKGPIVVGQIPPHDETSSSLGWLSVAKRAIQARMALYQQQQQQPQQQSDGVGGGGAIKFNLMAVIPDRRLTAVGDELAQEEAKRERWKRENERRRHNFLPLCFQIFKELARLGTLPKLIQEAQERSQQQQQQQQRNNNNLRRHG